MSLKRSQCFTPPEMVELALRQIPSRVWRGAKVLEPSAGNGRFVEALLNLPIADLTAIELDPIYVSELEERFGLEATVIHADFLKWVKGDYVCNSCPDFIADGCNKNPGCSAHAKAS